MIRRYVLPLLAVMGVVFAIYTVRAGNKPVPVSQPVAEPARSPFPTYVAGSGLIEAATENIAVGTNVAGVVTHVFAKVGDRVNAGQQLFQIDDRELRAQAAVREAALLSARAELERVLNQPRPEEIPVAEAKVAEAQASLENAKVVLAKWQRVENPNAVSPVELREAKLKVQIADAQVKQAQADLALLKAGAWGPDKDIARAKVASAEAQVEAAKTDLSRLTVKASVDGTVLQV